MADYLLSLQPIFNKKEKEEDADIDNCGSITRIDFW